MASIYGRPPSRIIFANSLKTDSSISRMGWYRPEILKMKTKTMMIKKIYLFILSNLHFLPFNSFPYTGLAKKTEKDIIPVNMLH